MSSSILLGAAAFATVAAIPFVPAQAQGDNTIVIEGPRVERGGVFRDERVVTASTMVYYDDLALDTEYGRDVLADRVRDAAKETCDLLSDVSYRSRTAESQCVRKAVRGARDQMVAAIARYNYYG